MDVMDRRQVLAGTSLLTLAALPATAQTPAAAPIVYIGTRGSGAGKGIVAARFDPRTGQFEPLGLVAEVARPTWLLASPHRPVLYAVSELADVEGRVLSFTADLASGKLTPLSNVPSGGVGPTHLALGGMPPAILVANFASGQVSTVPLGRGGVLSPPSSTRQDIGSGGTPRQTGPHAHSIALAPGGRFVLVCEYGADAILVYPFDRATSTLGATPVKVATPPGSGPRHMAIPRDGRFVYIVNELTGVVTTYRWNGATGSLTPAATVPAAAPNAPSKASAEIALSADERFLYVTNRLEDTIAVYAVTGATGTLKEIQRLPAGGRTPLHFALDPSGRWMLLANANAHRVAVFARDPATGRLTPTNNGLDTPEPSCVVFVSG